MDYKRLKKCRKAGALLPEETLKIILAVISIGLLVLLAFLLYGIFTKRSDVLQAEANMNYITSIVDRLGNDVSAMQTGTKSEIYTLLNPRGWGLFAWQSSEIKERPNACLNWRKCICFCEIDWFSKMPGQAQKSYLKSCNQLNVCKEVKQDELFVEPNPIQINELIKKDKAKEIEIILEKQDDQKTKLSIEAVSKEQSR